MNMSIHEIGRRTFLGAASIAAAGIASPQNVFAQAEPTKPRIGLILYTVREHMKTADDIARTLERIREIGYEYVQLAGWEPLTAKDLAKRLKQNGLTIVASHTGWDALNKDMQKIVDDHKELGCTQLGGGMPERYRSAQGYVEYAKETIEMCKKLAEFGMTFSYHNHSYEFTRYEGKTGEQILIDCCVPNSYNFEIDVYWVQHGGGDPAQWIRKAKGHVPTVHMKDMVILNDKQTFAEVSEGNLNWKSILKACEVSGVKYCIVEQDTCQRDPFESIAISLKNMKAMGLT